MSEKRPKSAPSLVTVDVGSVNTRAQFFDTVEGSYRLLASVQAPSTTAAPAHDLNIGVLDALEQVEELTGRVLLSERGLLISPDEESGAGANALTATFSGGPILKVITIGLLEGVSLTSVNNLVNSTYAQIVDSFSLGDRRKPEAIIDSISQTKPDLIVLGGGTNRGASRSVIRLANYLALALKLLPENLRPDLLFVGNENLQEEIESLLGALTRLHLAENIRPNLEDENLGPAAHSLSRIAYEIQARKVPGLDQLNILAGGHYHPTAAAFGRSIRFLSMVIDYPKGMLGVDIGASSTTVAAAFSGELDLKVYSNLGIGRGLNGLLEETHLSQISRWLSPEIAEEDILDYLYNKPLAPQTLPATEQDLAIEQAAARQIMRLAIGKSLAGFPQDAIYPLPGTVPWFDRIMVSGSVVAHAPRLIQSLLMILDSIQPVGIATIILDQNNLAAALGAGAEINPLLAVQVLESNSFVNLGTVISPVGKARSGSPVLRLQMVIDGEKKPVVEVNEGSLQSVSLPMGKTADVYVYPLQNMDVGLGPGHGGWVRRVVGGRFGLIVDARGRPITVPSQPDRRKANLDNWQQYLLES